MTGNEKLKKENQALRKEIQDLKNQLKKIIYGMSQAQQQTGEKKTREMSPGKEHSVEFTFDQFDDFTSFTSAGIRYPVTSNISPENEVQKNTLQIAFDILNSEDDYIDTPTLIKKVQLAKHVEK